MKDPDKNPIDLGPSSWDRWAAEVERENRRVEREDLAAFSVLGFVACLVVAVLGHWMGFW